MNISLHQVELMIEKNQVDMNAFMLYQSDLDWMKISQMPNLPCDFMITFFDLLIWREVVKHTNLPEFFLLVNFKRLSQFYREIAQHVKLSTYFIDRTINYFDATLLAQNQLLPIDLIDKHKSKLNIDDIIIFQDISELFIVQHIDELDMTKITTHQTLGEAFIFNYLDYLDVDIVARYQTLSQELINHLPYSSNFLKYQTLNEKYLLDNMFRFSDRDFAEIIDNQTLTMNFIEKIIHHVDVNLIVKKRYDLPNKYISDEILPLNLIVFHPRYAEFPDYRDRIIKEQVIFHDKEISADVYRFIEDKIDWSSFGENVPDDLILRNISAIDWRNALRTRKFSQHILISAADYLDWDIISLQSYVGDDFVNMYAHKLNWFDVINNNTTISYVTIKNNIHLVRKWKRLAPRQEFINAFIVDNRKTVDLRYILLNYYVYPSILKDIIVDQSMWSIVAEKQYLTESLILQNIESIGWDKVFLHERSIQFQMKYKQ